MGQLTCSVMRFGCMLNRKKANSYRGQAKGVTAMRYWYKLSDNLDREMAKRRGETPPPITLYPETEEIKEEFYEHGGWQLLSDFTAYGDEHDCSFDSLEDAERWFYATWDRQTAEG